MDSADPALNLKLDGGEEIRVPEAVRVYVAGNVRKPGAVTVREGDELTVLKLLAISLSVIGTLAWVLAFGAIAFISPFLGTALIAKRHR